LHLVDAAVDTANAMYSHSVSVSSHGNESPFWAQTQRVRASAEFGATENILCEREVLTVRVAILDDLARSLHGDSWHCRVDSNDTSIVAPHKCQMTQNENGAMFATVVLEAKQRGFATLTFREQSKEVSPSKETSTTSEMYIFEDPQFLRTFATMRVVDSAECVRHFGVRFADEATAANESVLRTTTRSQNANAKGTAWESTSIEFWPLMSNASMNWKNVLAVAGLSLVFYLLVFCKKNALPRNVDGGRVIDDGIPPAAWNPPRPNLNQSQNNPYLNLSGLDHSNMSFNM